MSSGQQMPPWLQEQIGKLQQSQQNLLGQAGQLASSPLMDPEKNPEGVEQLGQQLGLAQGAAVPTAPPQ